MAVAGGAAAQDPPKRLNADDLGVQTHKWEGKSILTTAQCFYADKDEYRCGVINSRGLMGDGTTFVRIDFSQIDPPEMKKVIEDSCDTVEKMSSRTCRVQIVFTYSGYHSDEKTDGSNTMYIETEGNTGFFSRLK